MIFVAAKNKPAVFLMLSEQDVNNMRAGRTVFVDERQTGGLHFQTAILSLHKSNEAALEAIRQSGHVIDDSKLVRPLPREGREGRCKGCDGIMELHQIMAGMCMVCWKERADHYELAFKQAVGQ